MNLKTFLFTAISLTLPASLLCAQENNPPPQSTPPPSNAPQGQPREGKPRRPDGERPDGQRGGGPQAEWQQRQQEFAQGMQRQFAEQMQRFGEEMQRNFAEQMQRWLAQNGPQGQFNPGQPQPQPGQQNPGPQRGGAGAPPQGHDRGPQAWMQRRSQFGEEMRQRFAQNGPQPGQPGPQNPGAQPPGRNGGPQFSLQAPWMHHRPHGGFGMGPGQGFAQNGPQFGPQAPWMHHHHHGMFGMQPGQGFAQNGPQFGPRMTPPMWMQRGPGFGPGPQGPFAMGPRMYGFPPGMPGPGPGPQDFRRFSHEPQPQDGRREFRGPQPGGQFPRPDGRRFDHGGMNQPAPGPGGPQPENRNPAGNGPQQHHHFGPPTGDNAAPAEGGAAGVVGPQSESAPEVQSNAPSSEAVPSDFGSGVPPAALGDVI